MNPKYFIQVFLVTLSLIKTATSTYAFETISDDDLVERIKSNEFVIVLFCKFKN